MSDLCEKYRPKTFDEVIGQKQVVAGIKDVLKRKSRQVFLLTGPPGSSKTSLARIIARELGCDPDTSRDYIEQNVAIDNGIDAMRSLVDRLDYIPIKRRVVVLDEFHAAGRHAVSSLLKPLEEPAKYNWFVLATTEDGKVPETIRSRAACFKLERVDKETIATHLDKINKLEKITKVKGALELIAERCNGSVRAAISQLAAIGGADDLDEVKKIVQFNSSDITDEGNPAYGLCKAIQANASFEALVKLVPVDSDPEGVRRFVLNWFGKGVRDGWIRDRALCLKTLAAFETPRVGESGCALTILSLGELKYGE